MFGFSGLDPYGPPWHSSPQKVVAKLRGLSFILDGPLRESGEMSDWQIESGQDTEMHDVWASDERQPQGLQFTPKVAPACDGRLPWFALEEAIDDSLDSTTLTPEKWAPSLKSRLVGDAGMYKPLSARERLRMME